MTRQKEPDKADTTYRYLHLSTEELDRLPPDELLRAALEVHRLLDIIMGVLYTPGLDAHAARGDPRPAL